MLTLQDLTEVYGRGIIACIATEDNVGHVYFTISTSVSRKPLYTSPKCRNLENPSWFSCDFSILPLDVLSLRTVIFNINFLPLHKKSRLIFQALINFSNLIKVSSKIDIFQDEDIIFNKLLFRLKDDLYTDVCSIIDTKFVTPKLDTQAKIKSYDINSLKVIIDLENRYTTNKVNFNYIYKTVKLPSIRTQRNDASSEKSIYETEIMQQCVKDAKALLDDRRKQSADLRKRLSSYDSKLEGILRSRELCTKRFGKIIQNICKSLDSVNQLLKLLNLRKLHMLRELYEIYPIEFLSSATKVSAPLPIPQRMTICRTLLVESEAPGTNASILTSWIDVGEGLQPKPDAISSTAPNGVASQHVQTLAVNRPITATVALAYVANLLRLMSFLLNVPLHHPIETPGQTGSRTHIIDAVSPGLSQDERRFPLFIQRNTAPAEYRYGVYLLNHNIVAMRSCFGLITQNPNATLWNLCHLLEFRLLPSEFLPTFVASHRRPTS